MSVKFLKRALLGSIGLGLGAGGLTYYLNPEIRDDWYQIYQSTLRITRLTYTGARMAWIYSMTNDDLHTKHTKAARLLCDAFMQNGGIYIKLGQMVATIDVLAPEEYITEMSSLYQKAKQSAIEDVIRQIEEHSGKKKDEIFSYFNPKPVSSASIAQVHDAVLRSNGQKVAVKVQHRWLREQSVGDIKVICFLIGLGEEIYPKFKYKWFGEELEKNLPKELDFNIEMSNAEKTKELFKDNSSINVPKIYREISNPYVIVMDWVDGVPVTDLSAIEKLGLNKKDVCRIMIDCFAQQIYKFGFVHSDPHPGNIFVSAKTDKKGNKYPVMTLLDHGLYQELTDDVRLNYSYLWKGILTRDVNLIKKAAEQLKVGEFHQLLAAMVARKSYDEIMADEEDFNKRLAVPVTSDEKAKLQTYAQMFAREITLVLHQINRDVLLLFKTNDFLATIANQLGSPIKKYEIIANYCFDAVHKAEFKGDESSMKRFGFWFERFKTIFLLKLINAYYSVLTIFKPSAAADLKF